MKIKNEYIGFILILLLYGCNEKEKILNNDYIIQPKAITILTDNSLDCNGRTWFYSKSLKPEVKNDILLFDFMGANDDSINFYLNPSGSVDFTEKEAPILLNDKKQLIIELIKNIYSNLKIHSEIGTDKSITKKQTVEIKDKKKVVIDLPIIGKSINSVYIYFTGLKSKIKIKAIYLQ